MWLSTATASWIRLWRRLRRSLPQKSAVPGNGWFVCERRRVGMLRRGSAPGSAARTNVRRSVIAGSWYPGDSGELRDTIEGLLARVKPEPLGGELVGLIAPHAGYMYSGQVAAYAYAQLQAAPAGTFSKVVVVS
ncbi:MAG: AmmeMemoRadiSam system protein B, partial [Chloroflexi bacterium]|nr:AmmeMemoRadiSam system protein B [Chloroflexota bacterium]